MYLLLMLDKTLITFNVIFDDKFAKLKNKNKVIKE